MKRIAAPSRAKINLFLDILRLREDGYHELRMVNAPLGLSDEVFCALTDDGGIELSVSDPSIPADGRNTAWRAARRFLDRSGIPRGAKIHIEKRIPHGAGLGGGSGNAAAVLKSLNQLTGEPLTAEDLIQLGASIGADVPFFLHDRACAVEGIGEILIPIEYESPSEPVLHAVLLSPDIHISTKEAYGAWDRAARREHGDPQPLLDALSNHRWNRIPGLMFNAFESVLFGEIPLLRAARDAFAEVSPTPPRLSGSGSNLFSLHGERITADETAGRVRERGYRASVHQVIL